MSNYYICSLDAEPYLGGEFTRVHFFDNDINRYATSNLMLGASPEWKEWYLLINTRDKEFLTMLALRCKVCMPVDVGRFTYVLRTALRIYE